jgi:signal peptidase I
MIVVVMFLIAFLVQPFQIPSESMVPTLRVGDFLLVNKQAFAPQGWLGRWLLPPAKVQRGDLVVFHYPVDPARDLVKRVVAVAGDRVRLRGGRLFLNGALVVEPYAFYSPARPNGFRDEFPNLRETDPNVDGRWWLELRRTMADGEVTVPEGDSFVLGDNRNDSEDSRYWGFVPRAAIEGRPLVVYFALPRKDPAAPAAAAPAGVRAMRVLH